MDSLEKITLTSIYSSLVVLPQTTEPDTLGTPLPPYTLVHQFEWSTP